MTGGDFPVKKTRCDRRNQQRWHVFGQVLAAQRRSNASFFLACRLEDILDEHYSFSDFFSKLCCALRGTSQKESQAYCSLGQGQMKADIASVVSLLIQQPRALQKHARLLATMQKRIVGQRSAVGTHCTMLNTQTSHAQRLKRRICSLWSSFLMSKSLPLVTLVWRAVMARVWPKT